ncbi:MAG: GNAT family N-acetyltransferase [Cyclobacteriaceae bacterium]|nr:GNAT family N-acetyltransferase [Cyclobacteriaceae bacterium]
MKSTLDIANYKEVGGGVTILTTQVHHAEQLEALQELVFPTLAKESLMRKEHYLNHIQIFPEGQFVAVKDHQVIGMTTTIRYHLHVDDKHTFNDVFDHGFLNTHQPDGDWLYGMDIGTHPDFRGLGIAKFLYDARQETVHKLGLKGQYTYGMLSGYGAIKNKISAEKYYAQVVENKVKDPTVSRQIKYGFKPYGLIPDYVDDPVCDGYCALLIRVNEEYKGEIHIE